MTGARRKARSVALQVLYEIDLAGHDAEAVIARLLTEIEFSEENSIFITELVKGVLQNSEEIDRHLQNFALAWPIGQIAVIDRNILRLAIFEILFDNKVPVKAAINEAVELAKRFASDNSAKFVNGVLGSVSALASK